tara:strand:- start:1605 stop:2279 length:675 start_codon:yes stop_codon:yes gene_type:complete
MNIAIFGYGKMGKKISEHALKKGHKILIKSTSKNPANKSDLSNVDVVIDFSTPNSAFENISYAINNKIPVISGTTNWLNKIDQIQKLCNKNNGAFLYSSNFSLGVNIFFNINRRLAELMKKQNYKVSISETHHTEKLDSPSGTAITIYNDIKKNKNEEEIPINSNRKSNEIGTHEVNYTSDIDNLTIKHVAKTRDGFALGALLAAEWIQNKRGFFTFADVLENI